MSSILALFASALASVAPQMPTVGSVEFATRVQPEPARAKVYRWSCDLPASEPEPSRRREHTFELRLDLGPRDVAQALESFDPNEELFTLVDRGADLAATSYHFALCTSLALRDEITGQIIDQTRELTTADRIAVVLNLASSFAYRAGSDGTRLPASVLFEETGDCDERALLACWLIGGLNARGENVGFGIVVTDAYTKPGKPGLVAHAGVAVALPGAAVRGWSCVTVGPLTQVVTEVTRDRGKCALGDWNAARFAEVNLIVPPGLNLHRARVTTAR